MFSSSRRAFLCRAAAAAAAGVVVGVPAIAAPMIKCPFCGFDNEDGALFCEQCLSDLSGVEPPPPPPPPPRPPGGRGNG
jgi:zinc-ribbon domain